MPERQAHAAHQTFQKSAAAADGAPARGSRVAGPGERSDCLHPIGQIAGTPSGGKRGTDPLDAGPAEVLDADSPEVLAQLESLDDAVFEAVKGSPAAMAEFRSLWPELKSRLGDALLAESCEHYIRSALSVWHESADRNGDHDLRRAVHALEVFCVLFEEL